MTQTEIAKKLQAAGCTVTTQHISLIVRGKRRFSIKKAKKAGEIFKVDPAIFLLGSLDQIREALNFNNHKG